MNLAEAKNALLSEAMREQEEEGGPLPAARPDSELIHHIPCLRYLGHGQTRRGGIPAIGAIAVMAEILCQHGWSIEVEVLSTGVVSMDVCHEDDQLAMELSPEGPEVLQHAERLIQTAFREWEKRGRKKAGET